MSALTTHRVMSAVEHDARAQGRWRKWALIIIGSILLISLPGDHRRERP